MVIWMVDIYTYEKSLKTSKKKSMGIFYTDSQLANYMINTINIKPIYILTGIATM